ncbi:hypothetical protein BJY01DRAFT_219100 [Aspergillus pseudoustus]|uniref:NAD-dependent epimerase/dehydratase domain-containing protein n=1 Tax=Aspergillus pseudoustus TaxID=1810923 RepID=A0ABR4JHV4_9EURO
MAAPKIFLTGASGYVGGDMLHALLAAHPDWESNITVLLRNRAHEPAFRSKYPKLNLFFATYDSDSGVATIESEVAKHELVLHFAVSADHLPSAQAIVSGLRKRGGGIYIHTSGTDVLLDPRAKPEPLKEAEGERVHVYDDWEGIGELKSLPDAAPHRNVDKFVLASGTETVRTAIVCPSTIYGAGRGPVSQRSHQIYQLTRLILEQRRGLQFADGRTFWNAVHVFDLSRLYLALVEDAVHTLYPEGGGKGGGGKATWNSDGYYLVENGIYHWGEIAQRITSEAKKLGLLPSESVRSVGVEDQALLEPAGRPVTNYAVRAEAVRARRLLGWAPVEGTLEEEIPRIVRSEARALGLEIVDNE